jgi:hypothetical protein
MIKYLIFLTFFCLYESKHVNETGISPLHVHKRQTNLCALVFCQNGGTCSYSGNLAICRCINGCYGMYCQFCTPRPATTINPNSLCNIVKCQNGGTCVDTGPNSIKCNCFPGYTGRFCEQLNPNNPIVIPPTTNSPGSNPLCRTLVCLNSGTCVTIDSTNVGCKCVNGWAGQV